MTAGDDSLRVPAAPYRRSYERDCRTRRMVALSLVLLLAAALIQGSGCTRHVLLPREQMRADTLTERCRVFMRGGREFRFESVAFKPDSLVGFYRILQERGSEREGIRFDEVLKSYPIALAEVDSVLLVERDLRKGLLYGAGAGALAGVIYILAAQDGGNGSEGGGGKPGIPIPIR